MICRNCKREIPDGSKYCIYCGSNLEEQETLSDVAENAATSENTKIPEWLVAEPISVWKPADGQSSDTTPPQPEQSEQQKQPEQQEQSKQPGQPEQPGQPKKSHRKLIIGISVAAVLIVLLGVGIPVTMMVVRSNHYKEAESLLQKEKYDDAKKIFTELDDYKDSEKNVIECDKGILYNKANDLIEKEDYEGAEDVLADLVSDRYKDSAELEILCKNKIDYAAAQKLLDDKSYYDAYAAFTALSGFEDADDKAKSCIQPTPSTGEIYRNESYGDQSCPLTFDNTTNANFPTVLQITTPDGTVVSTLYIAGGESCTVNVPAGTYYLKRTIGMSADKWFGNDELFGDLGMGQNLTNPATGDNNYTIEPGMIYTMAL